jgi:hypothetical protein
MMQISDSSLHHPTIPNRVPLHRHSPTHNPIRPGASRNPGANPASMGWCRVFPTRGQTGNSIESGRFDHQKDDTFDDRPIRTIIRHGRSNHGSCYQQR